MNREGTIGTATFLAIAAVVGVSLQSGTKPPETATAVHEGPQRRSRSANGKDASKNTPTECDNLQSSLEEFLDLKGQILSPCATPDTSKNPRRPELNDRTSQLKFVISSVPDPIHTHLSVAFDQFAVAIQEGAQDEEYEFDSSWFPWDNDDAPYPLLADEKTSEEEQKLKEKQPGIILFRKKTDCVLVGGKPGPDCASVSHLSASYRQGLVVFVVGEEPTQGLHRAQFRNALEWIEALQPAKEKERKRVAILGPTYSGSLPSLAQLLSEPTITERLDLQQPNRTDELAIYSGSISSNSAVQGFLNAYPTQVRFHSFGQSDDVIVERFCSYMEAEQWDFDPSLMAIISEDETAYGYSGIKKEKEGSNENKKDENKKDENKKDCSAALKLYYPRDISALRAAYQNKSLFETSRSSQGADSQRRSLPTDLSDPGGRVHDSIRSFGGAQTPLTQEAFMMEIVAALRELHARYILLRSSNVLDEIFLANFIRRNYQDGRIVVFNTDLLFIRDQASTGLNGCHDSEHLSSVSTGTGLDRTSSSAGGGQGL